MDITSPMGTFANDFRPTTGRAIGCFSDGVAIDLCDDFEGLDGGRESLKAIESGILGPGPSKWGRYRMMD
jgi:hypothetical protein